MRADTRPLRIAAITAITLCVGCGGTGTYPVEGKIEFNDGKPAIELAGGTVMFEGQGEKTRFSALGVIDKQAGFRLTTTKKDDGVPAGKYKVLVSPPEDEQQQDDRPVKKRRAVIDPRYQSLEATDLEVLIEKKRNEVTLKLKRSPS